MTARPMMMMGHCRKRMQSVVLARDASQMPPPSTGIDARKVMKFTTPSIFDPPPCIFSFFFLLRLSPLPPELLSWLRSAPRRSLLLVLSLGLALLLVLLFGVGVGERGRGGGIGLAFSELKGSSNGSRRSGSRVWVTCTRRCPYYP